MFTLSQIKEAHAKVKSGADFPKYIQDLIKLGVAKYDTYVGDGHAEYFGTDQHHEQSEAKYPVLPIAAKSDGDKFKLYLKIHQQGQTDYLSFCNHAAQCGVEKWTVDMAAMTCIYFDQQGKIVLSESIPR